MDGNMNNGYENNGYQQNADYQNQGYNQQNAGYDQTNGGYQNNGYQNQGYNQQNAGYQNTGYQSNVPMGNAPEYTLWLIIGVALTVLGCCCCCGGGFTVPIGGIVLICFACAGNSAYKRGDMLGYNKWFKAAKITIIVVVVLNILYSIIGFATGLFATIMDQAGFYY